MAEPEPTTQPRARAFWSGTITFGLVSIQVDLFAAVRPHATSLRMLSPEGQPLSRRYFCPRDEQLLGREDLVRGYEWREGEYVVVSDEELESIEPHKSRDIDLRRFVDRRQIDPMSLQRPYILAPAGPSTKAYHLLAETMERSGRAGIATFVMRGKEYLAAIYAEGGLLRAVTLRFADELRTPEAVGLPEPHEAPAEARRRAGAAIDALTEETLDLDRLRDVDAARVSKLADDKREAGRDLVEVPEVAEGEPEDEADKVVDIMALLEQRVAATTPAREPEGDLATRSKAELYAEARARDLPGRSRMTKEELIEALRG